MKRGSATMSGAIINAVFFRYEKNNRNSGISYGCFCLRTDCSLP